MPHPTDPRRLALAFVGRARDLVPFLAALAAAARPKGGAR